MNLVKKLLLFTTAFATICVLMTCRLSWLCLNELLVSPRGLILPPMQNFLVKNSRFPGVFDIIIAGVVVLAGALLFANVKLRGVSFFASFCIVFGTITACISAVGILILLILCFR